MTVVLTSRLVRVLAVLAALVMVLAACQEDVAEDEPAAPEEEEEEAAVDEEVDAEEVDEEEIASFYEGETFTVVVGFSAGGGYDTYARVIAAHIDRHIPGNPSVVVENLTGAGSLVAANQLYTTLPDDGSHMGHFIGGLLLGDVLGHPETQFDAPAFNYVGAAVADTTTCVARTDTGVEDIAELQDRDEPLVFGGVGTGSNTDDVPNTLREFFDLNIDLVTGYEGTADIRVAMEQGEVDAGCWAWESQRVILEEELEEGFLQPIAQAGDEPHPDNPDVPLFLDLAETEEEEEIVRAAIDYPALFARPFAMHPDTPPERVEAIRQAFMDTMEDEEFLQQAEDSEIAIDPITGEELQELVDEVAQLPDDLREQLAPVFIPE